MCPALPGAWGAAGAPRASSRDIWPKNVWPYSRAARGLSAPAACSSWRRCQASLSPSPRTLRTHGVVAGS